MWCQLSSIPRGCQQHPLDHIMTWWLGTREQTWSCQPFEGLGLGYHPSPVFSSSEQVTGQPRLKDSIRSDLCLQRWEAWLEALFADIRQVVSAQSQLCAGVSCCWQGLTACRKCSARALDTFKTLSAFKWVNLFSCSSEAEVCCSCSLMSGHTEVVHVTLFLISDTFFKW